MQCFMLKAGNDLSEHPHPEAQRYMAEVVHVRLSHCHTGEP